MRKFILVFAVLLQCMSSVAQEIAEVESYGSDNYIGTVTDLPLVRDINGGTVFNITYDGPWTNEMKGAFEYACKIWEESLPNSLPINVTARIGAIRGASAKKPLSKVGYTVYYDQLGRADAVLSSRIKGTMMREYTCSGGMRQFVDSIRELSFLAKPDIILTYNKDRLDEFSFSLESTPVEKYDFVTLVLRDIAKAIGFSTNITADKTQRKINYTGKKLTPFEWLVVDKLGNDPFVAYQKATQQKLDIDISYLGKLSLYAPSDWENGVSLNAFVPDSKYRITELLTYDYGKGTIMRDIHDSMYPLLFEIMLKWDDWTLTTGGNLQNSLGEGKTSDLIPFNGNITVISSLGEYIDDVASYTFPSSAVPQDFHEVDNYMQNFSYYLNRNGSKLGWKIAILKKDGTWDIVYENMSVFSRSLNVGLKDLEFHEKVSDYARTCDGYLRCRITKCVEKYDDLYKRIYYPVNAYYYVLDYLPQKVDVEYEGVVSGHDVSTLANDYTDDIKIGMKNLEGAKHVIVEQMDEGNDMPMRFEVKDFKKGYFVATVDKELYTQFKVIAINDNGQTSSDMIEVAPTDPSAMDLSVVVGRDVISAKANTKKKRGRNLSYEVFSVGNLVRLLKKGYLDSEDVDITSLTPGNYVLKLYDKEYNKKKTVSFIKK